ncbi:MAG: class I SAM-dependent methyltransferase [Salinivirgaceae bacterium]|jgi:O-methyltransferase|nr:class I SAM-dependent methyltransferase [Salinivirgaceae bacterium]
MKIFSKRLVKMRIPGTLKGIFFVTKLHLIIPTKWFMFFAHMAYLSKWISKHKNHCKNDFYTRKFDYKRRQSLYEQVVTDYNLDTNIDYFEFGVSRGTSFKWWVNRIKNTDARFYGFDTFTGLPEAWGPFNKGDMTNGNKPPELDDNRHTFYQGLFQQTLIPFLSNYTPGKTKVIHMDADIYSATLYVLTILTPYIKSGDIIFFDEFNVPLHEFKAFNEWSKSFYIEYKVLGGVNNFYQTAIMVM